MADMDVGGGSLAQTEAPKPLACPNCACTRVPAVFGTYRHRGGVTRYRQCSGCLWRFETLQAHPLDGAPAPIEEIKV